MFPHRNIMVHQGTYLTSTARSQARDYHLHEGTVIGNFNGEFWGMFASHQVPIPSFQQLFDKFGCLLFSQNDWV